MHYATFASIKDQLYKFFFPAGSRITARWSDNSAFPPLEPRKAAAVAQKFIDDHVPNSGASLKSIMLKHAWGPESSDCYWYYSIELAIPELEEFGDSELVEIPILMDGRIPKSVPVKSFNDPVPRPTDA